MDTSSNVSKCCKLSQHFRMDSKFSKSFLITSNILIRLKILIKVPIIVLEAVHLQAISKSKVITWIKCWKIYTTECRQYLNSLIVGLKNNLKEANISSKKQVSSMEMMMNFMKCWTNIKMTSSVRKNKEQSARKKSNSSKQQLIHLKNLPEK